MNLNDGSAWAVTAVFSLLIGVGAVSAGMENAGQALGTTELKSVGEIEAAIDSMADPNDQDRLTAIFFQLANREDAQEREHLQHRLDERLQALWRNTNGLDQPTAAGTLSVHEPAQASIDPEMLRLEIQGMRVGPEATVEDARHRDALFAQIARIGDPEIRGELLELFQQQER